MVHCGSRPLSSSSPRIQLSIFSVMSSLFHSHFTLFTFSLTSICSLAPSFPWAFCRLARTCSHSLLPSALYTTCGALQYTMHLVRHTRIPINLPAVIPSSAERGCSAGSHTSPVPFHTPATQHHLTSDRRGEHCVNKHGNGCQLHGQGSDWRGGGHIVHAAFYWV